MSIDRDQPAAPRCDQVQKYFWRNYIANSIEGGIYIGGMAFLSAESMMPAMVKSLGGPSWLISLTPMMMMLGCVWPPLFTAHVVERLERVKPFAVVSGLFQRLPYLLAALALFFLVDTHPRIVLAVVALAPFVSGLMLGIGMGAWTELVSKVIPEERRASLWAIRYIITALIGVGAGGFIRYVLAAHPGAVGYGILHAVAFGFLMVSFAVFCLIHETPRPKHLPVVERGLGENLRSLPQIVATDARLRRFIIARILRTGLFVMIPFLAIHALEMSGRGEAFLGNLVAAQMIGGIVGNLLAGYLGDRYGGKCVVVLARSLLVVVCLGAAANTSATGFIALFLVLGLAQYADKVGQWTLAVEICPADRRPTYISLLMTVSLPGMLVAMGLSTWIHDAWGLFHPAALVSAAALALSVVFILGVSEPRRTNGVSAAAAGSGSDADPGETPLP